METALWFLTILTYLVIFVGGFYYATDYVCWCYRKSQAVRLAWAILKQAVAIPFLPLLVLLFVISKKWFLVVMTCLWLHLDILDQDHKLYLRRFFMTPKTQWFHPRFLHYIAQSDADRNAHDHPGPFETTILSGGYDEKIFYPKDERFRRIFGLFQTRQARPGDTLKNPKGHTHMVTLIAPTWSWVRGWIKGQKWGFWTLSESDATKDFWTESEKYGVKGDEIRSWQ